MVDDSREEHRMMIFGNDNEAVLEHLIMGQGLKGGVAAQKGILERKTHPDSYTVTLYALLKDYGLTPVVRIKPRIRFRRSNYDKLSSSAPVRYSLDDIAHFAELKRGFDLTENIDNTQVERVFGDGPAIEDLSEDAALQLVSQRDLFLRQPPFKTKTKVFGGGAEIEGIPIGKFLDALNNPAQTEVLLKPFPQGKDFARDLLEALAPFHHLEFQFGLYSRYERRDCVLASAVSQAVDGYRTTFDPWTALGYIRSDGDMQQFQILSHERGTRWEHKIMLEAMEPQAIALISREIRALRRQNLIGRVLSKSQTGLTLLANSRESRLNLVKDLFVGYDLKVEVPISKNRFSDIEHRRKLHGLFNTNGQYQLHPLNDNIIERHLNLAKGVQNGIIYTLDNTYLMEGPSPQKMTHDGLTIIRAPIDERVVLRSAQDLRERIPANGFEKCWNEAIDEGGYPVINKETGRCYAVSYGKRQTGSILDGKLSIQPREYYLSIKYLGIVSERYGDFASDTSDRRAGVNKAVAPVFFDAVTRRENDVIREMKDLTRYLKSKRMT